MAANSRLRSRLTDLAEQSGRPALVPRIELCTDNGAMIAATAWWRLRTDGPTSLSCGAFPLAAPPRRRD